MTERFRHHLHYKVYLERGVTRLRSLGKLFHAPTHDPTHIHKPMHGQLPYAWPLLSYANVYWMNGASRKTMKGSIKTKHAAGQSP